MPLGSVAGVHLEPRIYGLKNKLQVAGASMMTDAMTAKIHRAEPGSGSE
jgi:hypothetical protein